MKCNLEKCPGRLKEGPASVVASPPVLPPRLQDVSHLRRPDRHVMALDADDVVHGVPRGRRVDAGRRPTHALEAVDHDAFEAVGKKPVIADFDGQRLPLQADSHTVLGLVGRLDGLVPGWRAGLVPDSSPHRECHSICRGEVILTFHGATVAGDAVDRLRVSPSEFPGAAVRG